MLVRCLLLVGTWRSNLAFLVQLQVLALVAKDLLLSAQDPYPYAPFALLLLAVIAGIWAASRRERAFVTVVDIATVVGIASIRFGQQPDAAILACFPAARLASEQPKFRRWADIALI